MTDRALPSTPTTATRFGAVLGATAIAAGAFGAHTLADVLEPRDLEIWLTAVRYQAWHALALFALPAIASAARLRFPTAVTWCWILGTLVFSGSLFALVGTGVRVLGAITPIGGLLMIAGWVLAAIPSRRS